jgi:hydrogenase nickel incorporation protein HypA/HybF
MRAHWDGWRAVVKVDIRRASRAEAAHMHELSLAQNVVDSVLFEVEKRKAKRVLELDVDVGELMQLDRRAFSFGLKVLMTGPILKGAHVHVRLRRASFSCRRCNSEWNMDEAKRQLEAVPEELLIREPDSKELPLHFLPYLYPVFVRCPSCGSSDIFAREGKEIQLRKLALESR